jgi:hypothetical protein
MLQYPASAYQINVKKIIMILKKENSLLTDKKLVIYSTDVITTFNCL